MSDQKYPDGYYQDGPLAGQPMPDHAAVPTPAAAPVDRAPETAHEAGAAAAKVKRGGVSPLRHKPRKQGKGSKRVKPKAGSDKGAAKPLHIPAPGAKVRDDRKLTTVTRSVLCGVGALALLGSCGIGGYMATIQTRSASAADNVKVGDLAKYNVTAFDTNGAAAYASRYLDACLTRYDAEQGVNKDPREARREQIFTQMNAAGEDQSCTANGATKARAVDSIVFTGEVAGMSDYPGGKYVTMQVKTSDGSVSRYSVPIAFQDAATSTGPRVVGAIGALPVPRSGTLNPDNQRERRVDEDLANQLQAQFIPQFLSAWTASAGNLSQFLLPGASTTAATGLNRAYTSPEVQDVTVYPGSGAQQADKATRSEYTYPDGSQVEVAVTVNMVDPNGNPATGLGYRLTLQRSNSHWFVKDVAAGAVGKISTSGAGNVPADSGALPARPSETPSAAPAPAPATSEAPKSSEAPKPSEAPKSSAPAPKSSAAPKK